MEKKWYASKTVWTNAIAIIAGIVLNVFKIDISAEIQVGILGIINLILRAITKEEIVW